MEASSRTGWLRRLIIVGVAYFVVGIAFGSFAGWSASNQMRVTWRLLAFLVSGVAFAIHIGYEHFRLLNSPRITASHAALAVALGAFLLAVAATVHAVMVPSHAPYWRHLLALAAWPVLTAVPAFVVALVAAAGLGLRRRST